MNLKTRLIEDLSELGECRDAWNELAGGRIFHRWEWMHAWASVFCKKGQLSAVLVTDEHGNWQGIAPWYKSKSVTRGTVVRQLASGAACSDYASIATRRGMEFHVARHLIDVIQGNSHREAFGDIAVFELEGHTADDPVISKIRQFADEDGLEWDQQEISGTWVAPLATSWEQFERGLSKSFQRKTRKATSRLELPAITVERARTADEVTALWPDFVSLHQKRRNAIGEPGCFSDYEFGKFLCLASLNLADSGMTRLNVARFGNQPFAANLEFVCGDTTHAYQSGMDPQHALLEPGHLIFAHSIRKAIDEGLREFDFLRGDEPYKERWEAERVPLLRTRIIPPRMSAKLRNGIWAAGRNVRNWARTRVIPAGSLPVTPKHEPQDPAGTLQ
jgi:CelD/BcsL family acetyltransferase involved in cellulose biosynthesis